MEMTKQNTLTREAYERGYRVSFCGKFVWSKKNKLLKLNQQCKKGKFYYNFSMRPKGENPTRVYVHKLQAYQLFGKEMFKKKLVVRHMDDVSTNNAAYNLRLGTQLENMMDKMRNNNSEEEDYDLPF